MKLNYRFDLKTAILIGLALFYLYIIIYNIFGSSMKFSEGVENMEDEEKENMEDEEKENMEDEEKEKENMEGGDEDEVKTDKKKKKKESMESTQVSKSEIPDYDETA